MKAHVSEKKKNEVRDLINLFKKYKTICIGNLKCLPSKQLQDIRHKLKKVLLIKNVKKRLIKIAIEQYKEKDLSNLNSFMDNDVIPVIILSNESPFSVYRQIKKNKVNVAAKAGQIAPYDLEVKAGPTNFTPGPIIGELGQAGIVAAVEGGKIVIKRDVIVAKKGEAIKQKVADILTKLGVEPMEVKLDVVACYENGMIYNKEVLDIDEGKLLNDIKLVNTYGFNLAMKIGYICKETIKHLIKKASLEAKSLNGKLDLNFIVEPKKSDEEVAKEFLNNLKEEDIKKKELHEKHKKEYVPPLHELAERKHLNK